jgi:alpha(1,3/1,4) fucosyltransferase
VGLSLCLGKLEKKMILAFAPPDKCFLNNNIFNPCSTHNRDNIFGPFIQLKNAFSVNGININTIDKYKNENIDIIIAYNIPGNLKIILQCIRKNPSVGVIYIQTEPELICRLHNSKILASLPFDAVFTWNDNAIRVHQHFKKLNIIHPTIDPFKIPKVDFNNKKFCCMVAGNKMVNYINELYSERLNAIHFLSEITEGFDLFGVGWESSKDTAVAKVYRGKIANKTETMCAYKYAICFENVKDEQGLITEKLFDSFAAGAVPIYYGASNVGDYIPKDCYIHYRNFGTYEKLYKYLRQIDEKEYRKYLTSASEFIYSPAYKKFTSEEYVQCLVEQVKILAQSKRKRNFLLVKIQTILAIIINFPFLFANLRLTRRFIFESFCSW